VIFLIIHTYADTTRGSERKDFLSEIDMMKKVSEKHNHNVVEMLGCVTQQEPLCIVTEFVKYKDLLSYLRSIREVRGTVILNDLSILVAK